ncbi:MFS transporter [Jiella sp. M17.18]|uniref:MFS transporter n=1 Tax=Jiella sp. M17.18 TaxID=3234247 RepID=UPI0034DE4CEB
MKRPRPFEGHYALMLTIALAALVPYILLTTAADFYGQNVTKDIGIDAQGLAIIAGIATAGYCFGALLGGDLINRIHQHRLFMACEALFVVGALLSGFAGGLVMYGTGRVLSGFATGLLLVVALPPVIQNFPASRMPFSAAFINIGFFGAVTAGPLIGGVVAATGLWRWLYFAFALIGGIAIVLSVLTLPKQEPVNPDLPFDRSALILGLGATVLPFWGAEELTGHGFTSPWFLAPMGCGLVCFAAMLLTEYHKKEPLAPVKQVVSTFPFVGILVAMSGGGVLVALLGLATQFRLEVTGLSPLETGLSFWPQVVAVVIAAVLVAFVLRTRYLPVLILCGMVLLVAAGVLEASRSTDGGTAMPLIVAGLLGLGAGTTVAPGLFLAGFSLPSKVIGRLFALIELVRSVVNFVLAPVVLKIARLVSDGQGLTAGGLQLATWLTVGMTILAIAVGLGIYLAGTRRLPHPDLEAWLGQGKTAVNSPELGARWRSG